MDKSEQTLIILLPLLTLCSSFSRTRIKGGGRERGAGRTKGGQGRGEWGGKGEVEAEERGQRRKRARGFTIVFLRWRRARACCLLALLRALRRGPVPDSLEAIPTSYTCRGNTESHAHIHRQDRQVCELVSFLTTVTNSCRTAGGSWFQRAPAHG